jgi:hypothetical protein
MGNDDLTGKNAQVIESLARNIVEYDLTSAVRPLLVALEGSAGFLGPLAILTLSPWTPLFGRNVDDLMMLFGKMPKEVTQLLLERVDTLEEIADEKRKKQPPEKENWLSGLRSRLFQKKGAR